MADSMLAQMSKEISDMKMPADARWSALMDSVRREMPRMPAMSASDMAKAMPAHHGRMTRLMDMYQEMVQRKPPPV
jgi:hypothetical protein